MGRIPPSEQSKNNRSINSTLSQSTKQKYSSRQRGVRASRRKLEKALHAAGLKTQAALANVIADKENIDTPPKDLVNKAFREKPVELQTLERIADALGVEAYTLYLSSDDMTWENVNDSVLRESKDLPLQEIHSSTNLNPSNSPDLHSSSLHSSKISPENIRPKGFNFSLSKIPVVGMSVLFVLITLAFLLINQDKEDEKLKVASNQGFSPSVQKNNHIPQNTHSEKVASINDLTGDSSTHLPNHSQIQNVAVAVLNSVNEVSSTHLEQSLSHDLRELLSQQFRLSSPEFHALNKDISPWELPNKIGVDFVIQSRFIERGRYSALVVYLINSKHKYVAFVDSWSHLPTPANIQQSAHSAVQQIEAMINAIQTNQRVSSYAINDAALKAYLNGTYYQDKALITENLTRAQTEFSRALRIAPQFLKARAALCDNLVRLSIANGDKSFLKDAELECLKINEDAQELPDFHYAMGQVNRKMGNLMAAQNYYENALKLDPEFTDALLGLAETYIVLATQQSDQKHFEKAILYIEQAEKIAPDFWKVPLIKGRVYFYSGNPTKGIIATKQSVDIIPNITNLNNLASVQFCSGDFKNAKSNFKRLINLDNAPSVSYYNLGLMNFYLGHYEDSTENIKYYIDAFLQDKLEGNYLFWTGLADSYRYLNERKLALSAYQTALQQIEVERLKGVNQEALDSYTTYIQLALSEINDSPLQALQVAEIRERLEALQKSTKDPYAKSYIVLSWAMLKEYEKALPTYRELSQSCKGFVGHPALTPLRKILVAKNEI